MRRSRFSVPYSRLVSSLLLCWMFFISFLVPLAKPSPVRKSTKKLQQQSGAAAYRPGELLVGFRAGVSEQQKSITASAYGLSRKKSLRGVSGIERMQLTSTKDVKTATLQLLLNPAVEFAEPNYVVSKDQSGPTPGDPNFSEQWALRNTGQNNGQYGSDIDVTPAWQTTTGGSTTVAVIDSGIDFTHPDLVSNEWRNNAETADGQDEDLDGYNDDTNGWDFINDSGVIHDEQGHGTAVAGIIAAEGNNGLGITGVMWHANVMSLRVLDNTGLGDVASGPTSCSKA